MAKTPHFFKIILDNTIQQGKLEIPKAFVRRCGNYLALEQTVLKVPTGAKWTIELVKIGDNIWLGNGWQHFVDYYSLSHGSLLVFGFEDFRNCTFNVSIFDNTASEITYPFHKEEPKNLEEQFNQENVDIDISEDESTLPFSRPRKKMKQDNCRTQSEAKDIYSKRTQLLTAEGKANALRRARSSYKSENPFFSIVMQPSYISKEAVTVPASFANNYFREERGIIILNSVEGKTWSVEYSTYIIRQRNKFTVIRSGWRKFVDENHLAIGDVCFFELINHNALNLKVAICRENHDAAKKIGKTKHLKHKEISCLEEFTTVNPYFKVKIQPMIIYHNHIYVPVKFMEKCKNQSMGKATLQVEKRVYPVKILSYRSKKRFRFSAGVAAFVDGNSLKIGDVCVFEMINSKTMLIKVSIFRKLD